MQDYEELTSRNKTSRALAWFHLVIYVLGLPLFLACLYLKSSTERLDSLKSRLGVLYEDLCYEKQRVSLWYYPLFTFRRLCFILQSVYLQDDIYLHLLLNFFWSTLMFIYILHYKPFSSSQTTRLEVFNEFIVMVATVYHPITYTLNEEMGNLSAWTSSQHVMGWSFIICVLGIMIPVNIFFSLYNAACEIWIRRKLIKYYFKKIVLRRTEVIRLRQDTATSSITEE